MREEVMNAVDSSKFITIARDSMKGSISKTDPFLIKEKGLEAGVKTAAPIAAKSGVKQMAETVVGVKTLRTSGRGIRTLFRLKTRAKNFTALFKKLKEQIKKIIKAGLELTGKGMSVTGKSLKSAGQGTKTAGTAIDSAGDAINTAAEASAAIPVADVVTVPTGLAAGTAVKGAGALTKGIGKLGEISGEGIEKAGQKIEKAGKAIGTAGGEITDKGFGVAGKVCNAMKRSFNPVTKIMGTALSGTVKAGRYSSKAASLSVSKMSELASKGLDKGDERALVR